MVYIYRDFVVTRSPLTGAFCNRTPKSQSCTFWSVHFEGANWFYKTIEIVFFEAFCKLKMLLLNIKKQKNSAGCAMTFCKEMSSRVEEPFYKNICFLRHWYKLLFRSVHVFDSTQSSDSCFGYVRNHSADTAECKTPFHGSFLRLQAPCHLVRHSPSFMAAILSSISFWIWRRHQLSSQRLLCRPRFFCKL